MITDFYRIVEHQSDAWFGEGGCHVEKSTFGRWEDVGYFPTRAEAQSFIDAIAERQRAWDHRFDQKENG